MGLTDLSLQYVHDTPLDKRKKWGQYMTPEEVSSMAADFLTLNPGDKIIDPAVGTGELLLAVHKRNPDVELFGWDIDSEVLKTASKNLPTGAVLKNVDSLLVDTFDGFFDAAIVNPPYFELTPTVEQKKRFNSVISGRANIYAFFIQKTLQLLKNEGQAVFIIPPSMNNGSYFNALREHVIKNSNIVDIKIMSDPSLFIEAQTAVQLLVVKKTSNPKVSKKHVVALHKLSQSPVERNIFVEKSKTLTQMWARRKSLHQLGYTVTTGKVTWNDCKNMFLPELTNKTLPLYYSKDITSDGKLELNLSLNHRRFLPKTFKPYHKGEAIIVNRIVGGVGTGGIRAAIVDGEYYTENHVNVVVPSADMKPEITVKQLHKKLTTGSHLEQYVQLFTGNTQLSAKELNFFVPV